MPLYSGSYAVTHGPPETDTQTDIQMEGLRVRLQLPAFVQERSVDRSTAAQGIRGNATRWRSTEDLMAERAVSGRLHVDHLP